MPAITTPDQFFGLGPADWIEARWGDRQSMVATARVKNDDGSDAGAVEIAAADTMGKWRVQLEAREVTIQGSTTAGTRTQSGGREGQTITLTSVLDVAAADMPVDSSTSMPYPVSFEVPVSIVLPAHQAWATGTVYAVGTPVSHGGRVWRCTQAHTATNTGATGPPSDTSTYWEPDPRVGKFSFVSPASRQLNPGFGAAELPGLVVWLIMSQGDTIIHRVLYGVLFRPGAPD